MEVSWRIKTFRSKPLRFTVLLASKDAALKAPHLLSSSKLVLEVTLPLSIHLSSIRTYYEYISGWDVRGNGYLNLADFPCEITGTLNHGWWCRAGVPAGCGSFKSARIPSGIDGVYQQAKRRSDSCIRSCHTRFTLKSIFSCVFFFLFWISTIIL